MQIHKILHFFSSHHMHTLCLFSGYTYEYNGNCATAEGLHPAILTKKLLDSTEACYALCQKTSNCNYFDFDSSKYFDQDSSGNWCQLYSSEITRGNGNFNVKCYAIPSPQNYGKFFY